MLAQAGWCKYALIDVSNSESPTVIQISNIGSMYDRSMLSYTDDENVQCLFGKTSFVWFTAGEEGCKVSTYSNSRYAEQNGIAYLDGKAIMINQNGYIYFDPYTIEQDDFNSKTPVTVSGVKLRGMPYIYGDYMIVVNTYGQKITVLNISDIDHPTLAGDFSVPGNPDKVLIGDNGEVLVSMRHSGTLRLTVN